MVVCLGFSSIFSGGYSLNTWASDKCTGCLSCCFADREAVEVKFYLGTHQPHWLERSDVPLFISYRRLRDRVSLPRSRCDWALDSGGFSEISTHGKWTISAQEYARSVEVYQQEVGRLDWAAPQDWMCEPHILRKTGLTVKVHQVRTIHSLLELRSLSSQVHFIPVLQGWEPEDYLRHIEMYVDAGIDLTSESVVGVGSVCRRQGMDQAETIMRSISSMGINIHAFGFKLTGLYRCADTLTSADSMAWSFSARFDPPMEGCNTHKNCANCWKYARKWVDRVREAILAHEACRDIFYGEEEGE